MLIKFFHVRLFAIGLLLAVYIVSPPSLFCQEKTEKIDELAALYYDYNLFNGTVLIAEQGKIIFQKGYGPANMEWDIPNDIDTKFRIGSITKQFTSMLILQSVERGELRLDGTISDYIPYYRKDTGDKITLHHLLTHTSGIPSFTGMPLYRKEMRNPWELKQHVLTFSSGDLEFEPGSEYKYCNSGYWLLGVILEEVTKKTYASLLRERILDPLGMKNTGYDFDHDILPHRASGYRKTLAGFKNADFVHMSHPYAAGALYSTVKDLFIWDLALYTEHLLSNEYMKKMFTPFLKNYAYGWIVRSEDFKGDGSKRTIVEHAGGIPGFITHIRRFVEDRYLIVVLNNNGNTNLRPLVQGITHILYDQSVELPKRSLAETLMQTIDRKGIDQAIDLYWKLKETKPDEYGFGQRALAQLGYFLSQQKRFDEAIAVGILNAEVFPEAFQVYNYLGSAYMLKGNNLLAEQNFRKALELNPEHKGIQAKLEKLLEKK